MRLLLAVLSLVLLTSYTLAHQSNEYAEIEENEFAEFDFEDEGDEFSQPKGGEEEEDSFVETVDEDDTEEAMVEDDSGTEFSHLTDPDEFINFPDKSEDSEEFTNEKRPSSAKAKSSVPTLQYANIPIHLRSNWGNYYLEILMIVGIVVYFLNFFTGKSRNQKIANQWFSSHVNLLESQFSLVGDDGAQNIEDIQDPMNKDSENCFTFWCSGRICCEGMLIELKLLKRQDLVGVIANAIKPVHDQLQIRVDMNMEDMENFIFAIASKKSSLKLSKEIYDINTYCPERRAADKYDIPGSFFVFSEVPEVANAMLDSKLVSVFKKYPGVIDTIHFSDQYSGPKPTEDQAPMELPQGKKVLIFVFNLIDITQTGLEETGALLQLVFYCIDKVKKFKLSKEAKAKADKNRSKVAENHWRSIHAAKAEKAAEERERKRREMKDKIKEIEDPDKQRKMEEKENRREKKKQAPKMKQLKVKAM
jgi:hypothetical protein